MPTAQCTYLRQPNNHGRLRGHRSLEAAALSAPHRRGPEEAEVFGFFGELDAWHETRDEYSGRYGQRSEAPLWIVNRLPPCSSDGKATEAARFFCVTSPER